MTDQEKAQQQEPEQKEDVMTSEAATQAEGAGEDASKKIEALENELAAAQAKADENLDHYMRAKAEIENIRRRMEKDVANAHKFALEKFAAELVPVIDSMELGLQAASEQDADVAKFREGSELTLKMFQGATEKFGIQPIDPMGEKFNPEQHQAMSMQEKDDVEPNTVITVVQKGYLLNDRVIRPAMVIVSKAATEPPKENKIDEMA
jgi:molecular chaperone GrpE